MKAIIWKKYGSPDNLQLSDFPDPQPGPNEILVMVNAAGVTAGDCEIRRLALPLGLSLPVRIYAGIFRPKRIPILGQEFCGEVIKVGSNLNSVQIGEQVYGTTGLGFGAYAEYLCLPAKPGEAEGVFDRKPANLSCAEAASLPTAGLEALHYLQDKAVKPGARLLVIGAGGSIGTSVIQMAKNKEMIVTAVDTGEKTTLMHSLGADIVIDYTKFNYRDQGAVYDLIIDVVGKRGLRQRLKLLKPGGSYYLAYARPGDLLLSMLLPLFSTRRLKISASDQTRNELQQLTKLIEDGKLKPVLDRTFPLEKSSDAHRYAESGVKKGSIALLIQHAE